MAQDEVNQQHKIMQDVPGQWFTCISAKFTMSFIERGD